MTEVANDNAKAPPGGRAPSKPCPVCGEPSRPPALPFCSRRCADVDLHRWLGGRYAIHTAEESEGMDQPEDPGPT